MVAFQLVTMGARIAEASAELFAKNAYREYLELHGLSVQLTEALAEYWHARIRRELGFGGTDPDNLDGFFRVDYRGARYSFGYPACPDLADRAKVMRLLEPSRIGVELSEEMQLHPEQSTDAIVAPPPRGKVLQCMTHATTAVLFDMDGLLIDSEPLWLQAETAVMARLGADWTEDDQAELLGGSLERTVRYLLAKATRPAPPELVGEWLMSDVTERVRRHGMPVRPGARELLASVQRRACRTRW